MEVERDTHQVPIWNSWLHIVHHCPGTCSWFPHLAPIMLNDQVERQNCLTINHVHEETQIKTAFVYIVSSLSLALCLHDTSSFSSFRKLASMIILSTRTFGIFLCLHILSVIAFSSSIYRLSAIGDRGRSPSIRDGLRYRHRSLHLHATCSQHCLPAVSLPEPGCQA